MKKARDKRKLDLSKIEEIRYDAFENAKLYKEKMKLIHDRRLVRKELKVGDKVLVHNTLLKFFFGKVEIKVEWAVSC